MKEYVVEIVAAYLRKNAVAVGNIPGIIAQVHQSLAELRRPRIEPPEEPGKPAVPIRRSVADEFVTCLECGAKNVTLRRHLNAAHGLMPDEYRLRWRLPASHPLVAPNYRARRAELARAHGLGARGTAAVKRRARASARSS
jgi:predicted transcriptional regulator